MKAVSRNRLSSRQQCLDWLSAHPELWENVQLAPLIGGFQRRFLQWPDHERIARAMVEAGLFSRKTNLQDIQVHKYIRKLRGLRVKPL